MKISLIIKIAHKFNQSFVNTYITKMNAKNACFNVANYF